MKLYNVPKHSLIKVLQNHTGPPDGPIISKGDILKFHHLDGMYSLCTNLSSEKYVYLPGWAEVEIVENK